MKFSRCLFGYSIVEVNRINNEIIKKYNSKKKSLDSQLENSKQEYDQLLEQRKILTSNLQAASTILNLYNEEFLEIDIRKAEKNAYIKLGEILREHEKFIEKINKTIAIIDDITNELKLNYLKMTNSLDKAIESIIKNAVFDKVDTTLINNNVAELISYNNDSIELFKAHKIYSLDNQIYEIISPPEIKNSSEEYNTSLSSLLPKRPKSVVIAENDIDTSSLIVYVLEREGYNISLATDGYILNNMIKENEPPDVIILDTLLPYVKTDMLIRKIRESITWGDVPLLVITSERNKKIILEALEWGANDTLVKPFNPRELVARVKHLHKTQTK